MQDIRLVLFDCDGTLVDSAGHIVGAMQAAFRAHKRPPPTQDEVKGIIGLSLDNAVATLCGDQAAELDGLVSTYKAIYRDATKDDHKAEPLFEGVREVLHGLNKEATLLGVATGKSRHGLDRILAAHDLTSMFVSTVTADEAASKPAPDMVAIAARDAGARVERTAVIGDSAFDMEMARRAGALAIGVSWGYHSTDRLLQSGAHAIASSIKNLPKLIDELIEP